MKYGDYILRLWKAGRPDLNLAAIFVEPDDAATLWYISLEEARRVVQELKRPAALLVHDVHGKQSVVFAYSRNF